jgi:hypothetical protein
MVQVIDMSPTESSASRIGKALGAGLARQAAISEAETAFRDAGHDPMKLATAYARLVSSTPELARSAGPMYDAMLRNMQVQAIRRGAEGVTPAAPTEQVPGQPPGQPQVQQPESLPGQSPGEYFTTGQIRPPYPEPIPLSEFTPGIQEKGPVSEEMLEKPHWTSQQRMAKQREYLDLGYMPNQAIELATKDEQAYLDNPARYRKRYEELEQAKVDSRNELQRQLQTKLQKEGKELFKDSPGEYLIGMEKGMERDLRLNPNMTIGQVADKWSTAALDTAKAKDAFIKEAGTQGLENFLPKNRGKTRQKFEDFAKVFAESGNQEQYYNMLKSNAGLSPQAAASIAWKTRPELSNIIEEKVQKWTVDNLKDRSKTAIKLAQELQGKISDNDSLLSISWNARNKDEGFDQRTFFKYISDNEELYNLNKRQKREIPQGESDLLPNWADLKFFPWGRE